jgi:pyruvate dehydrogenase (quinone)
MELKERRDEALRASTSPMQPGAENISTDHAPGIEEIRLRAYEIHLERGGFPGNELDDWLQAERELEHAALLGAKSFIRNRGDAKDVTVDLGLVGDIKATLTALLENLSDKTERSFLDKHLAETKSFHELLQHYVVKGPGIKPIRPEFLAKTLSNIASDDAMFFADTGTACIWLARPITGARDRRLFGSFSWASMANAAPNAFGAQLAFPGRQTIALCGDGGYTMLALGELLTQVERKMPVVQIILNNDSLDFVKIEQQEAGIVPFGVDFKNPNFAKVAEAMGAKGIRIEEPGNLREGLAEALAYKDGPVVVDAVVDPYALALPSHSPFHTVKGFTLSIAKQVLSGRLDSVIKTIEHNVGLV